MRNTHLLLILAAILITNSHLKPWYPNPILGVDGHLGNSLFYAMSGFGVAISLRGKPLRLLPFYRRRIARLYPAVILGALVYVLILMGEWNHIPANELWVRALAWPPLPAGATEVPLSPWNLLLHYATRIFYPSPYGYVTWILPFYFAIWLLARRSLRWPIGAILLAYIPFTLFWLQISRDFQHYDADKMPYWFWFTESFQYTMFGVVLARFTEHLKNTRFWRESALALLMLALYWGTKFLLKKSYLPVSTGVILFFIMYPTIYVLLRWSASADLLAYLSRRPRLAAAVTFLGGLTLEIYITQDYFQYCLPLQHLPFPLRIAAVFAAVLLAAAALHFAAGAAQKFLTPPRPAPAPQQSRAGAA